MKSRSSIVVSGAIARPASYLQTAHNQTFQSHVCYDEPQDSAARWRKCPDKNFCSDIPLEIQSTASRTVPPSPSNQ
ncbi:hypothetical protein EMCRGX_G003844 [Ephydatia muelleri]